MISVKKVVTQDPKKQKKRSMKIKPSIAAMRRRIARLRMVTIIRTTQALIIVLSSKPLKERHRIGISLNGVHP